MPLDPELPQYRHIRGSAPQIFDLYADPAERHDLAAAKPELVKELARLYDAWFEEVVAEWKQANADIVAHDRRVWAARPAPNPRLLFDGYWSVTGRAAPPEGSDPLHVFRGYWSYDKFQGQW